MNAEQRFAGSAEERSRIESALPSRGAPARAPRRLLVVGLNIHDGAVKGGHKSIGYGNLAIELMGRKTGAYTVDFCDDPDVFRPERLGAYDAMVFNNTVGVLTEDASLRQSILDFVKQGRGFVGIHAAAATFVQWPRYDQFPEFGQMLGAYENGGHPWRPDETIRLKLDDPSSPLNAGFGGAGFDLQDEVFQFQTPYSREALRVLVSIDCDRTDMNPERRFLPERFTDRDFAMSWIREYGRGRVFYTSFGHNPHLFWNPAMLQHYLAGIQYALGDLSADATPGPKLRT